MALQCIAGCVLAVIGMMAAFGLVRFVADLVILLLGIGALGVTLYCILTQTWVGWPVIVAGSLGCGGGAALLSLPAFPFSSWNRKKR